MLLFDIVKQVLCKFKGFIKSIEIKHHPKLFVQNPCKKVVLNFDKIQYYLLPKVLNNGLKYSL